MPKEDRAREKTMSRRNLYVQLALSFLAAGLATGCISTPSPFPGQVDAGMRFSVAVDSIAAPDVNMQGKTYVIACAIKDVKDDDLQFKEFAKYVENALLEKGCTRVDSEQKADLVVRLSYGVGTPQTTVSTYTSSYGYSYPVGWMWFTVPPTVETTQITSYPITLVLETYDLKTAGQPSQLWKTTVTGCSRVPNNIEGGIFVVKYWNISDLRVQIPYMIAAAKDVFGSNTGRAIGTVILGSDPRVFDVMGVPAASGASHPKQRAWR